MSRIVQHGRRNVVAYLALFVALGGTSYAAVTVTGRNVVNSSLTGADLKNGSIRGPDVRGLTGRDLRDASLRSEDFAAGELPAGPRGPQGLQGLQGPQGVPGQPGTGAAGWVVVNPNGTRARGSAGTTSVRVNPGNYEVTFNRDITNCVYVGNGGDADDAGNPANAYISTRRATAKTNAVFIEVRDAGGFTVDNGFHLAVLC